MTPLIPPEIMAELLANGAASRDTSIDPQPVVKLFTPDASATWLITEADPVDPDLLFGLCDLGMGFPELGYVRLSEIEAVRGALNLPPERDLYFKGAHPLSRYAAVAHHGGAIVSDF